LALHCGNQLGFTAAALVATAPAAAAASVLSSDRPSVVLPVAGRLIKPQTYLDRTHDAAHALRASPPFPPSVFTKFFRQTSGSGGRRGSQQMSEHHSTFADVH